MDKPMDRVKEKQASREEDVRAIAAGEMSQEDLRKKNGRFNFPNAKLLWDKVKLY